MSHYDNLFVYAGYASMVSVVVVSVRYRYVIVLYLYVIPPIKPSNYKALQSFCVSKGSDDVSKGSDDVSKGSDDVSKGSV